MLKLQFIHNVNGDESKTAKIMKGNVNHTIIDIQAMLVWLTLAHLQIITVLTVH